MKTDSKPLNPTLQVRLRLSLPLRDTETSIINSSLEKFEQIKIKEAGL
jgi:hypothetical protein